MKKTIIALSLAAAAALFIIGCSSSSNNDNKGDEESLVEESEAAAENEIDEEAETDVEADSPWSDPYDPPMEELDEWLEEREVDGVCEFEETEAITEEEAEVVEKEIEQPASIGTLIIVTTNSIKNQSQKLAAFRADKEKRGYKTVLATEDNYGSSGKKGLERGVAIREWLKDEIKEGETQFVLLLGDAHPKYGDVPMFTVWPRATYPSDNCMGAFAIDCRSMESDLPYANPSANFNLDGDDKWGERYDDDGEGGISFAAKFIVGRIPVYFDETSEMDAILTHAINYGSQKNGETAYRKKMLLPASFYYFKGQQLATYAYPSDTDGAATPEWYIHKYLSSMPEISYTRMYEMEGVTKSQYQCELPITEDNLVDEWNKGYGMVWWFGHGLERGVYRTYWSEDTDADQKPDGDEILQPFMLSSDDAAKIQAGKPAFVVADSCEVGSAETPQNLTYALLLSGASVGMVGSSNVTPGDATDYADPESSMDIKTYGVTNMGVYFFNSILAGGYPAKALWQSKTDIGTENAIETYAGKMMLNYFGDPTLKLDDFAVE